MGNKRGESTIIANLILFVAVMGMAGASVFVFKSMIDENTNAAATESDRTVSVMQTSFTITSAAYSSSTIYVYVKNTGKAQFDPADLDIYIDDIRVPRDTDNRTVNVSTDTDTVNTGIWDEAEEVEFQVFQTYAVPETHTVRVYTPNGVKAEGIFSS
jgi:archaellum component FlaG (FlaF/FlaG flagellin family)